ncbi:fungal-specific transcription factor domain-containing protein [Mycena maculata]|uniref:Fungal-specific transcription factor domain-containing protein n=1 Tax=Mycena maculata TaxID=230809 RepID=A0AAD7JCZ3_9AGAR|nr:fungal-specific transcription factor domain-containing protein [Mycena maculata]
MPAAPKSPVSKKPGAPKAKGAVRAKSGCYTCRIRRKKCDERQNEDGNCDTCVRLRLQCLGFGAKRPDWLRESRNVSEMRDKIKGFLAAQGMIKGHSGTGPRGADPVPILRLDEDTTPSSSESPPTPTLSLSPSEAPRPLQHESAIREQRQWLVSTDYPHSLHPLRGNSPFDGSSHSSHHDMYSNSYNSPSLVPWNTTPRSPALTSSFGATYTADFPDDLYQIPMDDEEIMPLPFNFYTGGLKPGGGHDQLVNYYLSQVMNLQYLLADSDHVHTIIFPSVTNPGASQNAARLLASIHHQRASCRSDNFIALQDSDTKYQYEELLQVLQKPQYSEDDALAAISMISSILFDGGHGQWQAWLNLSYLYAKSVFRDNDPRDTLQHCKPTTRFIIKTAIWFDVLAAITTQQSPRFLHYIRQLYSPEASGILDPSVPPSPELSMMSVMGCENRIVWVLAEASELSVWKRDQIRRGSLSVPELVQRANDLDKPHLNQTASQLGYQPSPTDVKRELSSNIFRSATRVYLRTIVSGDYPHVPEIMEAIEETMSFVRRPQSPGVHSSVVRSTVFAFFICGALTDDPLLRNEVYSNLSLANEDVSTSTVGNSSPIRKLLLQRIWHSRSKIHRNTPVPWRKVLCEANMLLV